MVQYVLLFAVLTDLYFFHVHSYTFTVIPTDRAKYQVPIKILYSIVFILYGNMSPHKTIHVDIVTISTELRLLSLRAFWYHTINMYKHSSIPGVCEAYYR